MQQINNCVNKPASLSKRLLSGLIDVFIVVILSYLLFTFVATPIANKQFDYKNLNESYSAKVDEYYAIAESYELGEYKNSSFDPNDNAVEGNEKYEAFLVDERVIELTDEINELSSDINGIANTMVIVSTLVVEAIFWLTIPLLNKKKKSLGMMAIKLDIIHKDDMKVTNKQIVYRFLSLYLLETVVFLFLFGVQTLTIMSPLISILFMYSSSNRSAIHDMIAKTKVVGENPILFNTIEERDNYMLFNTSPKKNAIEAEVVSNKKAADDTSTQIETEVSQNNVKEDKDGE